VLGIIKKKAQKAHSIIKKSSHNASEPQKINSGWKEIASAAKESVKIHKETSSGWDLITKSWKKILQPAPKTEKKPLTSPIAEKSASVAGTQSSGTLEPVAKPKSSVKSSPAAVAQPTVIGRPTPVSKKKVVLQTDVRPNVRPLPKKSKQLRPRSKPSLAKPKKHLKPRKSPPVMQDVTGVAKDLSDGWEELAAGWGQAPDGWNVVAPHPDDPGEKIELHFRKNVHTLSKILKEMADELFLAIQQRDDQILFIRTELQKYKNKAKRLELTVQQHQG